MTRATPLSTIMQWKFHTQSQIVLRNTSRSLGEQQMLWEYKLTGECFRSFFEFSQTFTFLQDHAVIDFVPVESPFKYLCLYVHRSV